MVKRGDEVPTFDQLFDLYWSGFYDNLREAFGEATGGLPQGMDLEELMQRIAEALQNMEGAPGDLSELAKALLTADLSALEQLIRDAAEQAGTNRIENFLQVGFFSRRTLDQMGLEGAAEQLRDQAYLRAAAALRSQRYTELLLRVDLWLEDGGWAQEAPPGEEGPADASVARVARQILDKRDRRLRKLSKKHDSLTEAEMHGVRLLAKKKRYSLEFFGSLFRRKAVSQALNSLKEIQDKLGTYNDAVVGARLLKEIAEAKEADASAELAIASAAVNGWQAAVMERDIEDFREAWADYESGPRFWRS